MRCVREDRADIVDGDELERDCRADKQHTVHNDRPIRSPSSIRPIRTGKEPRKRRMGPQIRRMAEYHPVLEFQDRAWGQRGRRVGNNRALTHSGRRNEASASDREPVRE